jgi:hypothetical protein
VLQQWRRSQTLVSGGCGGGGNDEDEKKVLKHHNKLNNLRCSDEDIRHSDEEAN